MTLHRPGAADGPVPEAAKAPEKPLDRPRPPADPGAQGPVQPAGEQGGPKGPEPTRFGDWEKGGRCFDF